MGRGSTCHTAITNAVPIGQKKGYILLTWPTIDGMTGMTASCDVAIAADHGVGSRELPGQPSTHSPCLKS